MSLERSINCDGGCGLNEHVPHSFAETRRILREHGWRTSVDCYRDLCPDCVELLDPDVQPAARVSASERSTEA